VGISLERIHAETRVDPWFLDQMSLITEERAVLGRHRPGWHGPPRLAAGQAARLRRRPARPPVGGLRGRGRDPPAWPPGCVATFKTVDTCGAEFEAETPYHYSTYEDDDEVRPGDREKVLILGSGPNRIGQGIEFDYCCVHASFALRDAGYETIMLNCNPETVSTDYDTSDRLYFEPLTFEDVMNVIEVEQAVRGRRAEGRDRVARAVRPRSSCRAAARGTRARHLAGVHRPGRGPRGLERPVQPARDPPAPGRHRGHLPRLPEAIADEVGYPVLVRPSYVLGGRAMEIVYDDAQLDAAMAQLAGFGSLGK
jgi:carbamoyl-phosphate synthase large subunit